jgi:PKD repeat protein
MSTHVPGHLVRIARKIAVLTSAAAILAAGAATGAITAVAAPANDNFATATVISPGSLPFSDSVSIDAATLEPGEPSGCYQIGKSIWYAITPTANGVLRADIGSSTFFDRILYVYRQNGTGFSGLSTVACAGPYYNGLSGATFTVVAGSTYYLQAGGFYPTSTGTLNLSVQAIPPPANDDFANATRVGTLPFTDTLDTSAATTQAGEPFACGPTGGTAWYVYTPTQSGSVTASGSAPFQVQLDAYRGTTLGSLSSVACNYGRLTIHVDSGATYYFQVAAFMSGGGPIQFQLVQTPPPIANLFFYPGDPSLFDTVQFYNASYDPAQVGFQSQAWTFGDGTSSTLAAATHRYMADGSYTVRLSVTTFDGRTASTSTGLTVKTHDVAISKLTAPEAASVGQTRAVTVGVSNSRYDETVQVQLYKSDPTSYNGFDLVGTLTQSVPVQSGNRTIGFAFSYTFTSADATVGKVTFEAIATIVGARDAQPADNTAISGPAKVS